MFKSDNDKDSTCRLIELDRRLSDIESQIQYLKRDCDKLSHMDLKFSQDFWGVPDVPPCDCDQDEYDTDYDYEDDYDDDYADDDDYVYEDEDEVDDLLSYTKREEDIDSDYLTNALRRLYEQVTHGVFDEVEKDPATLERETCEAVDLAGLVPSVGTGVVWGDVFTTGASNSAAEMLESCALKVMVGDCNTLEVTPELHAILKDVRPVFLQGVHPSDDVMTSLIAQLVRSTGSLHSSVSNSSLENITAKKRSQWVKALNDLMTSIRRLQAVYLLQLALRYHADVKVGK